jgi:predicted metalloprotease with PDZ domain
MIRYQISSLNPATHYFEIKLLIEHPDPAGQCLRMPNWIPGSYIIRDFAKNIVTMSARSDEASIAIMQQDKSNWRLEPCPGPLTIEYQVYAWDLSVRGAHLDQTHGYYNGTSVFMEVIGQSQQPCEVLIEKPAAHYCSDWKIATTLPAKQAAAFEFGLYAASDYDELIDHPVEMGNFAQIRFEACGIPHDVILSGRFVCDEARLKLDLSKICEHHIEFFGGPAPIDYYQFQVMVVGAGYGGLEHRSSTSLMCARDSLPQPGQTEISESYRDFLGLCSHEYFHTWNVKRIKPTVYQPYDLQQEVYTELLWAFEGITSYYDDLALVRCGLIDETCYLELLAQTMTRVLRGKGSSRQSAADSSFNAWTKFYKQDENAQNAIVSYYTKGCLIALCIDLKMRQLSQSEHSLDGVMQQLWQSWKEDGTGVDSDTIQNLVCSIVGNDLHGFMHKLIYSSNELPLPELLDSVGIKMNFRAASNQKDKGGKVIEGSLPGVDFGAFIEEKNGGLRILRVSEGGSTQAAGLSANDEIIAINDLKLTLAQLEAQLSLAAVGERWKIHAFRRDELMQFELSLQAANNDTVVLQAGEHDQRRQAWLTGTQIGD